MILGGSWIIALKEPRSLFPTVENLGNIVDSGSCERGQISLLVSVSLFRRPEPLLVCAPAPILVER